MKLALGKFLLLYGLLIIFNSIQAQQHEWAKAIKSTKHIDSLYSHIHPFSLKTDSKGNVFTSGPFGGLFDFNPNNGTVLDSSLGYMNSFILKLDSNGNYNWNQTINGNGLIAYNANIDQADNFILTGNYFHDTLLIDTVIITPDNSTTLNRNANTFVIKFNKNNQLQWASSFQFSYWISNRTIKTDSKNNIYITGV